MSWRCVYRFMEKMGVGLEKTRIKKKRTFTRDGSDEEKKKVEKV